MMIQIHWSAQSIQTTSDIVDHISDQTMKLPFVMLQIKRTSNKLANAVNGFLNFDDHVQTNYQCLMFSQTKNDTFAFVFLVAKQL
jgi:hypothetical protein